MMDFFSQVDLDGKNYLGVLGWPMPNRNKNCPVKPDSSVQILEKIRQTPHHDIVTPYIHIKSV